MPKVEFSEVETSITLGKEPFKVAIGKVALDMLSPESMANPMPFIRFGENDDDHHMFIFFKDICAITAVMNSLKVLYDREVTGIPDLPPHGFLDKDRN